MSRVVYSTETGRHCPNCNKPIDSCTCSQKSRQAPQGDGIVRLQLQTKGRKGKGVTVITGLALAEPELKKMAKDLKKRCSTGGAVKEDTIEIQGDQRSVLEQILLKKGYSVKISGA